MIMSKESLIASIKERGATFDEVLELYASMILDEVEDDEQIKELATPYVPDVGLNGDQWGVTSIVDVVETLIENLKIKK